MKSVNLSEDAKLARVLGGDGIAVIPTDTLYGIVGRAESPRAVERIYDARGRSKDKPCIVLVADMNDLNKFDTTLSAEQKYIMKKYWPGAVSVVLDFKNDKFSYLHRSTDTLAFRLPIRHDLRDLIRKVGPLVAPSANLEDQPSAKTIEQAKKYFGNKVDLYVDEGAINNKPSKVIRLHEDGSMSVIRE